MKNKVIFIIALTALCSFCAVAQSAERLSDVLSADSVTYGQASYFSAVQLQLVSDSSSYQEALSALQQAEIVRSDAVAEDPISLSEFALICCKTWDISNSLLYRFFPKPRYAFRQLQAEGIISSISDPSKTISGHEMLNIITDCIELSEGY